MSVRGNLGPPVEVFRTHSSIEAEVVRGLLDAHGIESALSSALAPSVFPIRFGHAEFRVSVPAGSAISARALIASHLDEAAAAEVRRLSENLGPLETRIDYRFRDLGLLEHALTHRSRAHEDASGRVTVHLFDDRGDSSAVLRADRIVYFQDEGRFVARGDVEVISQDEDRLETETLEWVESEQRVSTPGFVRITTPTEQIQGYQLEAEEDLDTYRLAEITGRFEVEDG